jgi:2-oxo-3-hexenedioate decarboxylase/2-keto-4-pentenoate hydratase
VSLDEAYLVQEKLHKLLIDAGYGRIAGHKIGCTTDVMQQYLKIDTPCAGKLFETTVCNLDGEYERQRLCLPGVECEIAVRLSSDLLLADVDVNDAQANREFAAAAVDAAMASIELVDSRWLDFSLLPAATLIADDFFGAGCVLSEEVNVDPLTLDELTGSMFVNGAQVGEGRGSDILGHPLDALVWLARLRQRQGQPLRQSEFVTLGSMVKTQWIETGDRVNIVVDGLGGATLRLV